MLQLISDYSTKQYYASMNRWFKCIYFFDRL